MRKPARASSLPTRGSSSKTCRSRRLRNKLHQTLPEIVRRPSFQCDACNKHFSRQQSLNKHRDRLHPSNGMKCELCGACFRNRSSIVKHIQTHAKTPVCFCTLCNETFTEFKALDKHVKVCRRSRRKMEVSAVVELSDSNRKGNPTSVGYRGKTTRSKRIAKTTVERLIEESSDCHVIELVEIDDEECSSTLKGDGKSEISLPRPAKPACTHECIDTDEFVCEVCGIKFVDDKGLSEHHHDELATEIIIEKATDGDICEEIDDFWKNRFWNSDRSLVYMKDHDSYDLNNVNQGDEIDEFPALVAGSIIHQASSNPTPSLSEEYPPSSNGHQDACYELTKVNGNDSNKDGAHVSKSFNYGTSFGFGYPVTSSASIVISDTAGHSMSLGAVYYECIGTEFKTFTTRGLETENSSDGVPTAGFSPVTQTPVIQAESLDDKMDFLSSFVNSPDVTMTNVRENSPLDECTVAAATPEEVPIGDKWFVCGQCSEQFETKSDLEVHIELFDHGGDLCFTEISYKASGAPCSSTGVGAAAYHQNDDNKLKESSKNDGVTSIAILGYPDFGNLSDVVYGDSPYSILSKVEKNMHMCSYCGKALSSFDLLMSHINKSHNMFTAQTDLDDHAKHNTKKKECHICGKMLEPPLLKDHIRSHDPPEEVRIQHRKCDLCSKRFDSMQSLASHQYLKHVLPAGGGTGSEVSYTCPHCRQQMQSKDVFIAHVASHTGVFPFECSECKQGFLYQSVLKTHINKTHVKTALKYRCQDCDKNFNTLRLLQRHRRKPFDCGECKKVFYCRDTYKKHMKEHKCKAPFSCDLCCKTFTVRRNWVAHQQIHNDME